MCAFCGETVETLVGLDPCLLIVVGNWRGTEEAQREQQFFAHANCLLTRFHPDAAGSAWVLIGDPP
jgi:hypothetical protein